MGTLLASISLITFISFLALDTLFSGITLVTFVALVSFITLLALGTLLASISLITFISFLALDTLFSGVTLVTFVALLTLYALGSLGTGITFITLIALVTLLAFLSLLAGVTFITLVAGRLAIEFPFAAAIAYVPVAIVYFEFRGKAALSARLEGVPVGAQDGLAVERPVIRTVGGRCDTDGGGMAVGTRRTSRTVLSGRAVYAVLAIFSIQAVLTVVDAAHTAVVECNLVADDFAALYQLFDGRHVVAALQHIDRRLQHLDVAVKLAAQGLQGCDPALQIGNPLI